MMQQHMFDLYSDEPIEARTQEQRWRLYQDANVQTVRHRIAWHRQHMARLRQRLIDLTGNPDEV